jgi:hypothetical protein
MMGAAGYAEHDDGDDDELVLEYTPEEEETGKLSEPGQAEERMLQVAAWIDKTEPSHLDEQPEEEETGQAQRSDSLKPGFQFQ